MKSLNPLITQDPVNGDELIVTRLEGPRSGIVIEGRFSLDWMGRLTPQQLTFVGLLVKYRGNIQRLAACGRVLVTCLFPVAQVYLQQATYLCANPYVSLICIVLTFCVIFLTSGCSAPQHTSWGCILERT